MSNLTDQQLIDELQKRFRKNNETLKELRETTEKLINVNKKLEKSESMKSHFISNITNDIINPFSSILGLTKHLINMEKDEYEKMKEFAQLIHQDTFELDFQLMNIFAAAKLEAGEFSPKISNVKVVDLLKNIINNYRILYHKKNIEIVLKHTIKTTKQNKYFKTDSDKLHLVCSNLLNNSILFSPDNNKISINLNISDEYLELTIKDNGIGINTEYSEKIYDRFYRIDHSIHSENKGLGLGLAVTKGILEMLGGEIWFENHKKGCEFFVKLPEDCSEDIIGDISSNGNEIFFDEENQIF